MAGEVDGLACRTNVVNPKDGNSGSSGVQSRGNRSPEALLWSRPWVDLRKKRFPAGPYRNGNLDGFDDLSNPSQKLGALLGALGETKTRVHHDGIGGNSERKRVLCGGLPFGANLSHDVLVAIGGIGPESPSSPGAARGCASGLAPHRRARPPLPMTTRGDTIRH